MTLARHTAFNLAGQMLPLALSLLTIPIYLRLLGEARFGVLALIWLFFGYMGLFDLGIGQATARQLSRAHQTAAEQAQVLWTAFFISAGLGLVGTVVAELLGVWYFEHHGSIESGLRRELLVALPLGASLVLATTLAGVLTGALQARRAFVDINAIGVLANTLVLVAPLIVAARVGTNLVWLVSAVVIARLAVLLFLFWRCYGLYLTGIPLSFNKQVAIGLFHFGRWATVTACIGPLMVVLDRFIIGSMLGAKAVSHYVIPFQLAERATSLSSALNYALFPRLAESTDEVELQRLSIHGLRVLALWTSPLIAFGILMSGPFLGWWISPELAVHSTMVTQVLCFGFWINGLAMVPYTKLLAGGRPDLVAKSHVAELLPYLLLLYAALRVWGLVGVALIFSLRVLVDLFLLLHLANLLAPALRLLAIPAVLLIAMLAVVGSGDGVVPWRWPMGLAIWAAVSTWALVQTRVSFLQPGVKPS